VSHQDRFGNNRTEPTATPTKPDNDGDGIAEKDQKCPAFSGWYQTEKAQEFTALSEFATHKSSSHKWRLGHTSKQGNAPLRFLLGHKAWLAIQGKARW
jgi:hypothetical protein